MKRNNRIKNNLGLTQFKPFAIIISVKRQQKERETEYGELL